jgi:hypothetical protein
LVKKVEYIQRGEKWEGRGAKGPWPGSSRAERFGELCPRETSEQAGTINSSPFPPPIPN